MPRPGPVGRLPEYTGRRVRNEAHAGPDRLVLPDVLLDPPIRVVREREGAEQPSLVHAVQVWNRGQRPPLVVRQPGSPGDPAADAVVLRPHIGELVVKRSEDAES